MVAVQLGVPGLTPWVFPMPRPCWIGALLADSRYPHSLREPPPQGFPNSYSWHPFFHERHWVKAQGGKLWVKLGGGEWQWRLGEQGTEGTKLWI